MKTKTTITELTHDDLVTFLSGAFYGNNYFSVDYEEAIEHNESDCLEDIMAKILLHEGFIKVIDHRAEGDVYGQLNHEIDPEDEYESVTYFVGYDDIKRGFERAADGLFNAGENSEYINWRDMTIGCARRSFDAFVMCEDGDFDADAAECLLQIILFDEIIYG